MAHVHYILKAPAGFNCADNADRLHFSTLSPGATHTLLRTRGEHQIYIFHHSPGCQSPNPKSKWYFPRAGGATRKMQSEQWRINAHDSNMAADMDLIMHATQRHSQRGLHIRRTRAHQYKRAVCAPSRRRRIAHANDTLPTCNSSPAPLRSTGVRKRDFK
jgi:hypothetical protein